MTDLQDLINKLRVDVVNKDSYVYYTKETGKIHKISSTNIPDSEFEVVAIPTDEVKPILTGERRTEEFVIFYDVSLKQIILKEAAYDDSHKTASTMCYQLPVAKRTNKIDFIEDYTKVVALRPQYLGLHVDVWYDKLAHLAGQHVWINNTVYRLLKDQHKDTEFDKNNAELIIENVKLYADVNKALEVSQTVQIGDLILSYNNIFVFDYDDCNVNLENDIVIRQDTDNNVWNIRINPHTKKFLRMSGYNPKETLYFSVTAKYDPNILYRSLEFNIGELLAESTSIIPFKFEAEQDPNNVSIYTAKYFDKYVHEII